MELSIVSTLYKSEKLIDEFYSRISKAAEQITDSYEIIFVNDGSPDNSIIKAIKISEKDSKVKVINLSRNFGHHKAMITGLGAASGKKVFLIDSDLEEEPELLLEFNKEYDQDVELDMLFGVQEKRKGGIFEQITGYIWYKFFNLVTNTRIPENVLTIRIMSLECAQNLAKFQEQEPNFSTLVELNGFIKKEKVVKKRDKKSTSYTLLKRLNVVINSLTSSSDFPLWLVFCIGSALTGISLLVILFLLYKKIFQHVNLDGWVSIMVSIFFFGGITIFFLGLIGIYLSKILTEAKTRPYTIIKSTHGF